MPKPVTAGTRGRYARAAKPYMVLLLPELRERALRRLCADTATPLERDDARADLRSMLQIEADMDASIALADSEDVNVD